MNNFPDYLRSVDPDGNTIALICQQAPDSILILSPVKSPAGYTFDVQIHEVTNQADLKNKVSGWIIDATPSEYNDVLFKQWGFDTASSYRAFETPTLPGEEIANDENNNPGSDLDEQTQDPGNPASVGVDPGVPTNESDGGSGAPAPSSEADPAGSTNDSNGSDEAPAAAGNVDQSGGDLAGDVREGTSDGSSGSVQQGEGEGGGVPSEPGETKAEPVGEDSAEAETKTSDAA